MVCVCGGVAHQGGGRGLFAKEKIAKDEVVWKEVETFQCKPRTMEFVQSLPDAARRNFLHFAYCTWITSIVLWGRRTSHSRGACMQGRRWVVWQWVGDVKKMCVGWWHAASD